MRTLYLVPITWNDWFEYSTLYEATFVTRRGEKIDLSRTKVAHSELPQDQSRPLELGQTYAEGLPEGYYSLGQSPEYYSILHQFSSATRAPLLAALRDVVADEQLFKLHRDDRPMWRSLLRYVSGSTVTGEFQRRLTGAAPLTRYTLKFVGPYFTAGFDVDPNSRPNSNVHVVIGRNGVGKTQMLRDLSEALMTNQRSGEAPSLLALDEDGNDEGVFAGLVYVSFSAFDTFEPPEAWYRSKNLSFQYVGLKKQEADSEGEIVTSELHYNELAELFIDSMSSIDEHSRMELWRDSVRQLESDPTFEDLGIADQWHRYDGEQLEVLFDKLSDGHKAVLLSITSLVEHVEERTLVILDEPEAHLHPPLLSAFTRCLSSLLQHRNAVAIVATHSPVVLQEVPANCASILIRFGTETEIVRPRIETYGEDVATLTHEVFGLEVRKSGYHQELTALAAQFSTFEAALRALNGQLGSEGRAILRTLFSLKARDV